MQLKNIKNIDELIIKAKQAGLLPKTAADLFPSVGGLQQGQQVINPTTKEMYTVKDIIDEQGQQIIEVQDPQNTMNSLFFNKDEFGKTVQPIQGLQSAAV
jgi:hypothetical protein